jgi:hypothetical protein
MTVQEDSADKKRVKAALEKVRKQFVDLNIELEGLKDVIDGVPFAQEGPTTGDPKKGPK